MRTASWPWLIYGASVTFTSKYSCPVWFSSSFGLRQKTQLKQLDRQEKNHLIIHFSHQSVKLFQDRKLIRRKVYPSARLQKLSSYKIVSPILVTHSAAWLAVANPTVQIHFKARPVITPLLKLWLSAIKPAQLLNNISFSVSKLGPLCLQLSHFRWSTTPRN